MQRIEFISPVEALRGNLSGKQSLMYADNNNPAWDAPEGRQYARNYSPRFIGAKRAKDGKTYFAVKTKSAVKVSAAFKTQNAILAASSVIANICMENVSIAADLQARYKQTAPEGWSFKRWLMSVIRTGLKNKQHFAFSGTTLGALFVGNPYLTTEIPAGGTDISSSYPQDLLAKFWLQLANNAIEFKIDSTRGIAQTSDDFDSVITSTYNILGLTEVEISGTKYIKWGNLFLKDNVGDYVVEDTTISNGEEFVTTSVSPA